MKRSILVFILLLSVGLVASCAGSPSQEGTEETTPVSVTITDDLGREVTVEATPASVVSLAPSATEILFALDLGDAVVAVTEACDYPAEARNRPKVGPYYSTSLEMIVDQDPDVVFTDGHDPVGGEVEKLGIPLVVLQPDGIPGVLKDIELAAKVMGAEQEGGRLVAGLQERLDAVAAKAAQAEDRPGVFFEIDASDPVKPWTAGPGSLVDAMIGLAGGRNVVTGGGDWAQIDLEELLSAGPEIILLSDYPYVTPDDVVGRAGAWQELPAVRQNRVYAISDPSLTSRPGPRIIDGLEEMAGILHPELFPE